MKQSVWGYAVIVVGLVAISMIWFFTNITNTDQHNYALLKETVENAMYDSVDLAEYRKSDPNKRVIKIDEEKFVENFIRRFAENASLSNTYKIEIYDVNETPPKVSLKISSVKEGNVNNKVVTFDVVNHIDAILETKY